MYSDKRGMNYETVLEEMRIKCSENEREEGGGKGGREKRSRSFGSGGWGKTVLEPIDEIINPAG